MADFDAIVVGAGPAGSAAALELARAGRSVCLLERGPFPGSKNMYGGVIYGRILDTLIPNWWDEMPVQRWVTRRSTMLLTGDQALTVDFRSEHWGAPPYNGATSFRPDFDAWLADKATDAGAVLVTSTTATGLLRDGERVVGVVTDRPDGDLTADVVIACDGVNSFLAKEAGLYGEVSADNYTVGVKETIALPRDVIDERFGVRGDHGVDFEIMGCTGGVPGGGFIYTNADSLAVGLVLSLPALAAGGRRPEELLARDEGAPGHRTAGRGGRGQGVLGTRDPRGRVRHDAGADRRRLPGGRRCCRDVPGGGHLARGRQLRHRLRRRRGTCRVRAIQRGDTSSEGLAGYRTRLESSFVLADHRKLRDAPHLVMGDLAQTKLPALLCGVAEGMFRVENPDPKPGLVKIVRREMKANGVKWRDAVRDGVRAMRTFG